jgi:hypothetical protein
VGQRDLLAHWAAASAIESNGGYRGGGDHARGSDAHQEGQRPRGATLVNSAGASVLASW